MLKNANLTQHSHRDYFNNETFSDIILEFGPFKIHAHKVILASNSTWFEKAFSSGFSVCPISPIFHISS